MSARKQINRYRTEPSGTDFDDVVRRAKRFYKNGIFGVWKYGDTWSAFRPSIWATNPKDAIYYKYTRNDYRGKWEQTEIYI